MEKKSLTKNTNNNSKNIYTKLLTVWESVGKVAKGDKKNGMPFNPILHDEVNKVCREALIKEKLIAIPKYVNQRTIENYFYLECNLTIINCENPREKIEIEGASAFAKIDKYATGNAMSYATKYAYLKALALQTGEDSEDGFKAPNDFVVNRRGLQTKLNKEQSDFMDSEKYQNMSSEEQKKAMNNFDNKRKAIDKAQENGGKHGIEL
jgi:hypothetical protein